MDINFRSGFEKMAAKEKKDKRLWFRKKRYQAGIGALAALGLGGLLYSKRHHWFPENKNMDMETLMKATDHASRTMGAAGGKMIGNLPGLGGGGNPGGGLLGGTGGGTGGILGGGGPGGLLGGGGAGATIGQLGGKAMGNIGESITKKIRGGK